MTVRRFFTQIFRDEGGSTLAWTCVLTLVLLGFTSLVVDVGFINHQVAEMQKTADAAALAGAKQLPNESMAGVFVGAENPANHTVIEAALARFAIVVAFGVTSSISAAIFVFQQRADLPF